jgi:Phosphoribosylglycinamide synthetase, N domain
LSGNGGTIALEKAKNVDIGVTEFQKLVKFAQENNVNLVVPGPEVPLVDGIESWFRKGEVQLFAHTNEKLEYPALDQLKKLREWKDQRRFPKNLWNDIGFPLQSHEYHPSHQQLTLDFLLLRQCAGLHR